MPACGGPVISDAVYNPIKNEDDFMVTDDGGNGGGRHPAHMPKRLIVAMAIEGACTFALLAVIVCALVKRKRAQRRRVEQQLQSLLPSYAPSAGQQQQQVPMQHNHANIPMAEPVYPSMHQPQQHQHQQQFAYTQLVSAPAQIQRVHMPQIRVN